MFLELYDIETIQLDHSSRCNLACPQCARNIDGGKLLNPEMNIADLSVSDYEIILQPFDCSKITIFHCGNFGDCLASPTFDETFDYCVWKGVKAIKIVTNGSLRSKTWWSNLPARAGNTKLIVVFSIDGLEDTNHLYRVNSNYKKIIENARAFIQGGGIARWDFIEFEHNYHQIDQAEQLSKELGFTYFNVKYTSRFAERNQLEIENKKNNKIQDRTTNPNKKDIEKISEKYNTFYDYAMSTEITCKYKNNNTVFIDMNMCLWPCTWHGAPKHLSLDNVQRKDFEYIFSLYGRNFNNLRIHGWSVLETEFFTKYLENSWKNSDDKFRRLYTCGRTCGCEFEYSSAYGKNTNKKRLK